MTAEAVNALTERLLPATGIHVARSSKSLTARGVELVPVPFAGSPTWTAIYFRGRFVQSFAANLLSTPEALTAYVLRQVSVHIIETAAPADRGRLAA